MTHVELRDTIESDIPLLFQHQLDAEANRMAAFTVADPSNYDEFMARWAKFLANDIMTNKTILFDGEVVGNIACFEMFGEQTIAYWIDKPYWGKGIATAALTDFLKMVPTRPLYARAAKDNFGSVRVLQKCDFVIIGEDSGFANARGGEIEEFILMRK